MCPVNADYIYLAFQKEKFPRPTYLFKILLLLRIFINLHYITYTVLNGGTGVSFYFILYSRGTTKKIIRIFLFLKISQKKKKNSPVATLNTANYSLIFYK